MSKAIKTVKKKSQLRSLISTVSKGKDLLDQWINLDPIFVGKETSADYMLSIHKQLIESTKQISIKGHWCEFGVREGRSLNWLIKEYPQQIIHAFDSWQGLPEDWNHGTGTVADMSCDPPVVPAHIKLHKGWFKDTLHKWKKQNAGPIAFLHMDADIYSSTKEVLLSLDKQIVPGTVITFDEFCNFRLSGKMSKWQDQEFLALIEWLDECKRQVKPVNRNWAYQASCVVLN
tara:strand:+ start:1650 stop:2342 length:693 start_codon:yes stop_codon:yes gene_type:complete